MGAYRAPLRDINFLLQNVFEAEKVFAAMPETKEITDDLISAILDEAGKIAEQLLSPINQSGDRESCHFENGKVNTPKGFKEAYEAYAEGGWPSLTGNVNYGGQGMPKVLSAMIEEMFFGANSSFCLCFLDESSRPLLQPQISSFIGCQLSTRYCGRPVRSLTVVALGLIPMA